MRTRSNALTSLVLALALGTASMVVGCDAEMDLAAIGLADEPVAPAADIRILLHQAAGSPGTELARVTAVLDDALERAARAPGSGLRVFAMSEDGPPVALLDERSPELPRRPRARERHVDRYVAERRAQVLERYLPLIDIGLARSELADAIDRLGRLDPVPGTDDIDLIIISDLREASGFGRFARRTTLPTNRQVLVRASARRIFEPASFVGIRIFVVHVLLPARRLDSSAAHEARLRDRWGALFGRAGAADVRFSSGPPSLSSDVAEADEE